MGLFPHFLFKKTVFGGLAFAISLRGERGLLTSFSVTDSLPPVYINRKFKRKEVIQVRKMTISLGLVAIMLFAGVALAADQTRTRSKDRTRTIYTTGTQDRTQTRDQQKSQDKARTQTRAKDGAGKTAK